MERIEVRRNTLIESLNFQGITNFLGYVCFSLVTVVVIGGCLAIDINCDTSVVIIVFLRIFIGVERRREIWIFDVERFVTIVSLLWPYVF